MDGERRRTIHNTAKQLSSWSPRKPHSQPGGTTSKPTKCQMGYTISEDATKASRALCKMKYAALQARASHGPKTAKVAGANARSIERQSRHKPNSQNSFLNSNSSSSTLPPPRTTSVAFRRDYLGRNVPPFKTQYLLSSQTNMHAQNRLHYCTVDGCSSVGFERKGDLIRHSRGHQPPPEYVCPFCPDHDRKYLSSDKLEDHVRARHVHKDMDNSQLQDVLAKTFLHNL
ncbi:hypothetical protein FB567DRAFT_246112 [Paraphoma chrysanthemicola]|uniref:C2H2-type domain-containing protein n=1 Tax=Paraphoma chrysanthemicola TaxID=798071 RepID=A0A8K0QUT3_9PLEO|nr:hypothetical protein FB567DRAFT_246112 [Paraphoma chrysanthemicola]